MWTRWRRYRGALMAIALFGVALPAWASDLWLPAERGGSLLASIGRDCPSCLERGLVPCGTADIRPGRRFAAGLFQGTPPRGYFLTFTMSHQGFRTMLVDADRAHVSARLGGYFGATGLIVVENEFGAARVLPTPDSIEVVYSSAQHQCLAVERRSWACCHGDGGSDRACLPKADAPHVVMTWHDAVGQETLVATYAPVPGFSRLIRRGPRIDTLYYCLSDEAGRLRVP